MATMASGGKPPALKCYLYGLAPPPSAAAYLVEALFDLNAPAVKLTVKADGPEPALFAQRLKSHFAAYSPA